MENKSKLFFSAFCIILLGIGTIIYHVIDNAGGMREKPAFLNRVTNLKIMFRMISQYEKSNLTNTSFNLYDAVGSVCNYYGDCLVPGASGDPSKLEQKLSRNDFYKFCEYRLLRDELGWWGIVELRKGKLGDYYLMITQDGKIIKMKEAFLPEQLKYEKEAENKDR